MAIDNDLESRIATAAAGPAEASGDNHTIKQQPLADLVEADRYLHAKAAASMKHGGLRFTKLIMPGARGGESSC